jgi:hypothetical protein
MVEVARMRHTIASASRSPAARRLVRCLIGCALAAVSPRADSSAGT